MDVWSLPNMDVSYLTGMMFDAGGHLQKHHSSLFAKIPIQHLQLFAVKNGIYQYLTDELIDFLQDKINGKKAIEICAGIGGIAYYLGIVATDSYMQQIPEINNYYKSLGQQPISPPSFVKKFEANEAVDHFNPEVVVGSWVTQLYQAGDSFGSVMGVDEVKMLSKIKMYIHIGNEKQHSYKRIMQMPHEVYRFPWLISRSKNPHLNCICVWRR